MAHLVDDFDVVGNYKLPVIETLTENLVGAPAEESLCSGRPAQHFEFLIPFDDCEWRVLNVESESPVIVGGCCVDEFPFRDVANDRDAADDFALFVVTRGVVTIKETVATGLGDNVGTVLSNDALAGEGVEIELVFTGILEAGKQLERVFTDNIFALHTRDVLHRAIPGRIPAFPIESDNAIDIRLQQALEKEILFLGLVGHRF